MKSLQLMMMALVAFFISFNSAHAATCPVKEFVGQSASNSTLWHNSSTGVYTWTGVTAWQVTPYTDDPTTTHWSDEMEGVAATTPAEYVFSVKEDGTLGAFGGANITTSLPSGATAWWSLDSGTTGRFAFIGDGTVYATGVTTDYTAITGTKDIVSAGRDLVCAGNSTDNSGLVCSGTNTEKMIALLPSTGNVVSLDVSRYAIAYVLDDGTVHVIVSGKATGAALTALNQFATNAPTSADFVKVRIYGGAGSTPAGIAQKADGSLYIWQSNGALTYTLRSAPGFDVYGHNTDKTYIPQGPSGPITFSDFMIDPYGANSPVGAVIDNGKGLVVNGHTYTTGDAFRWDGSATTVSGVAHYWPVLKASCY